MLALVEVQALRKLDLRAQRAHRHSAPNVNLNRGAVEAELVGANDDHVDVEKFFVEEATGRGR